ncbi:hypothetical protein [Hymenobacter terricola]|uniref:hypothetical protein n=1 Tax=Hymenobacter terricola TaxID=2819236 RepID=UPI001CF14178|nr:hypothetical protein [Hymenobacter terricola]
MEFADQSTPGRRFKRTKEINYSQTFVINRRRFHVISVELIPVTEKKSSFLFPTVVFSNTLLGQNLVAGARAVCPQFQRKNAKLFGRSG